MQHTILACFGQGCEEKFNCYNSPEDAKKAKHRDKQITRVLRQHHREELKRLKILLLGKISWLRFSAKAVGVEHVVWNVKRIG